MYDYSMQTHSQDLFHGSKMNNSCFVWQLFLVYDYCKMFAVLSKAKVDFNLVDSPKLMDVILPFCLFAWIQLLGLKSAIVLIKNKMEDISISAKLQVANFGEYKRVGEIYPLWETRRTSDVKGALKHWWINFLKAPLTLHVLWVN